ncbi:MAG TPA: cytochrome c-type biogenesis protein CcmH, partial [Hyphomonas atlantica]|nr:cytochrome c-type biogenesis protein CcmH [Hyphomonas atlantica]
LFRPKAEGVAGWMLWGLPFALLLIGGWIGLQIARSRKAAPVEPIAPEDV